MAQGSSEIATLESVLRTEELSRRPPRPKEHETENRALTALVQALSDSPRTILQTLAESILEVCRADSAGLSLLNNDGTRFSWPAIAGVGKSHIGGGTPREFGPCGDVFDRNTPLLFTHPERRYPYLLPTTPATEECLMVPFYVGGRAVGTVWAVSHDERRQFDAEDLRLLQSLARFASAAYQSVELHLTDVRFRTLFESIDEGFCVIEKVDTRVDGPIDFRYIEANAAFALQSGVNDVLGKTIREVLPDLPEEWMETYDSVCRTGEPVRFERRLDQRDRVLELHAFRVDDDSHRRVAVIFKDISSPRKVESALRVSEIRYRRLFESAKDGILILDATTGKIVDANPFMSDLLGYASDEFTGKELWEIGLFKDKSAHEAAVRELQEHGYLRYEYLKLESNRGGQVEVEIVANAYQEGDHRVIQCNIRDITDRSRLERKTQEQAEALAELHHRKDEFLAMLSHELRSPLAAISNAVKLLSLESSEDELREQARAIIERKVAHLRHLVDDLLEVARITTGRVQLRQERIAIGAVLERAVETVRPLIATHRHQLTVWVPPQAIWLHADAARLEQVLVNLLTNAAKYSQDDGRIWISLEEEGESAVVRVRDVGVGIAPELLPHIFDLFTQAERSLDRSDGGLGVGLCLVQRLVALHGGSVEATSVLGQGSEFVVRLPVMRLFAAPAAAAAQAEAAAPGTTPVETAESGGSGRPMLPSVCRVLIVDDDEDTAESLAALLLATGHEVRMAHDGPAALQAAAEYRPDVMLLDIGLPMLDGFEVAEKLRERGALEDIVLVAVTGYGQDRDRQRTKAAGFDYHLVKPADVDDVQEILAAVAGGAVAGRQ